MSEQQPEAPATPSPSAGADLDLTPEALRELKERFRKAVENPGPLTILPSEPWKDRAEAAEAKLAAITDACRSIPSPIANRILAIIGSREEADRG